MESVRLVTISEAARMLGVSEVTLRRWDKIGRLLPTTKLSRGERLYDAEKIRRFPARQFLAFDASDVAPHDESVGIERGTD